MSLILKFNKGIAGIGHFNSLPDGWRLAKDSDFINKGALLVNVPYLMLNHSGEYEAYRTKAVSIRDRIQEIRMFISLELVYVLK